MRCGERIRHQRPCGGGQQLQKRHVTREPANGGELCPENFERFIPCNEDFCPIDCAYAEWSGFDECDAPGGPMANHRYRSVIVHPEHGGVDCEEETEGTKSCKVVPCSIDCEYAQLQEWFQCSRYGGLPCSGPKDKESTC